MSLITNFRRILRKILCILGIHDYMKERDSLYQLGNCAYCFKKKGKKLSEEDLDLDYQLMLASQRRRVIFEKYIPIPRVCSVTGRILNLQYEILNYTEDYFIPVQQHIEYNPARRVYRIEVTLEDI